MSVHFDVRAQKGLTWVKTLDDGFFSYNQCFSIYKMLMIDMLTAKFESFLSAVGTLCRESIGKQVM